jgi:antitoxin ParD1/3/4
MKPPRKPLDGDDEDLAWAKPYVDEALAAVARGEVMSLDEHKKRIAALLADLKKKER